MARPWQLNLVAHKLPQVLQAAGIGMMLNLQVSYSLKSLGYLVYLVLYLTLKLTHKSKPLVLTLMSSGVVIAVLM